MRSKRIGLGLLLLCLSLPSCILGQDVGPSASENPVRSLLGFLGIPCSTVDENHFKMSHFKANFSEVQTRL